MVMANEEMFGAREMLLLVNLDKNLDARVDYIVHTLFSLYLIATVVILATFIKNDSLFRYI